MFCSKYRIAGCFQVNAKCACLNDPLCANCEIAKPILHILANISPFFSRSLLISLVPFYFCMCPILAFDVLYFPTAHILYMVQRSVLVSFAVMSVVFV